MEHIRIHAMVDFCPESGIIKYIPDKGESVSKRVSKTAMSLAERDFRSKLVRLVSTGAFIRGTLSTREKMCGKPNCKCTRGEKHIALYLVVSQEGRLRQLFVPKSHEETVRQWIEQYRQAEALLEEISNIHWEKLQNREV
jgi:hypothetical protein